MSNVRMSIDVSEELHRRLKTYCAAKSETIREYVVHAIKDRLKKERVLKDDVIKTLQDSDKGIGLKYYNSLEEMYKDLDL